MGAEDEVCGDMREREREIERARMRSELVESDGEKRVNVEGQ